MEHIRLTNSFLCTDRENVLAEMWSLFGFLHRSSFIEKLNKLISSVCAGASKNIYPMLVLLLTRFD